MKRNELRGNIKVVCVLPSSLIRSFSEEHCVLSD